MADRYEDQYRRDRGYQRGDRDERDRGFMDRAGDEVRSWFGDEEAERRRQMDDRERGQFRDRDANPGNYGSRSGWYDDRRYGQSAEYGGAGSSGSGSYGSGGYGSGGRGPGSYGAGSYGSGAGSYYGSNDRGEYGGSDRSYGSADRGSRGSSYGDRSFRYGDRTQGYGGDRGGADERTWPDRGYDRHSGADQFRSSAAGAGASYGPGASWPQRDEGDRGTGWFTGRGPKGYQRSDSRINDDVCDRLCDSAEVDATDIEVQVANGEVTLTGRVSDRSQKRRAEDLIEQVSGVREVHNNLRVGTSDMASSGSSMTSSTAGTGTGSSAGAGAGAATGTTAGGSRPGSSAAGGTGSTAGTEQEQPGNVLGVTGGVDKAAGAGRR
jgi:osmotically-inducible protein OsmY